MPVDHQPRLRGRLVAGYGYWSVPNPLRSDGLTAARRIRRHPGRRRQGSAQNRRFQPWPREIPRCGVEVGVKSATKQAPSPNPCATFTACLSLRLPKGRRMEEFDVLHIADAFGMGAADEEWIPKVAQQHGVVLTQDMNIHRQKQQFALCQKYKIGIFFFRPPKKTPFNYWQWVDIVIRHWAEIKRITDTETRPFAFSMTRRSKAPERLSQL